MSGQYASYWNAFLFLMYEVNLAAHANGFN